MKNLLNLGLTLNKTEQRKVFGGGKPGMGDCFQPGTNPPLLIGHAPCDGSLCPTTGLLPMCFSI